MLPRRAPSKTDRYSYGVGRRNPGRRFGSGQTVQILKQLEKCPWLRRDFLRLFQIEVEDLRAQTNFEVIEHLSDHEQHDWAHFGKLRREWDRQFEDPDDVYLKCRPKRRRTPEAGIAASAWHYPS